MQRYAEADDDSFPWELVQEQVTRLEREKQTVTGIIADIQQRISVAQAELDQLHDLQTYIDRVACNLKAFDFAEKRLALEALGVTVYANGRDWRMDVSIPLPTDAVSTDTLSSRWCRPPR
jgi:hypothetical protein